MNLRSPLTIARHRSGLRASLIAVVALVAVGLSGCSIGYRTTVRDVTQNDLAAGGEPYFNVGPVTYQVQISRALNPFATEDSEYLTGVANAQKLPGNRLWFGVFLLAKNQTDQPQLTASHFEIVDSAGTVYHPVHLNTSINLFAWTPQRLSPNGTEPGIDTTASNGPTGGSLILFDLSSSVYSNRPLILRVSAPGAGRPSNISLDL